MFDDKTDSKSKWVKKLIVWLCCPELSSIFVKTSICDALSLHGLFSVISECVTQGIRIIETFLDYKHAAAGDKFITKKHK